MPRRSCFPLPIILLILTTLPTLHGADLDPWTLWRGPTMLRGANIYQRHVYPELDGTDFMGSGPFGPPYTQEDFDALAALGANYVNLSCMGVFSRAAPYGLDPDALADLDRLLEMAGNAGLFAVISFRTGPGRSDFSVCCLGDDWFDPEIYQDDTVWTSAAAQDAWVEMWRYTAARYGENPVVAAYDLMVEPNSNDVFFDEWDPVAFYAVHGGSLYDWNQLYPRIIDAIRTIDTRMPILVQPNGYGAVDWLSFMRVVSDTRTIYAVHQYEPYVFTHQEAPFSNSYPGVFDTDEDGIVEQVDRQWLDNLLLGIDTFIQENNRYCAVNEMGVQRWEPGAETYLADEISLLEERGLNWAVWAWEPAWPPWAEEVTDFNFRFGPDPSNHRDIPENALEAALKTAWASNTIRPSGETPFPALLIPAAANLPGANSTDWRTEVQLKATGSGGSLVSVTLLQRNHDNSSPRTTTVGLEAQQSLRYTNVLQDLFEYEGAAALILKPLSGRIIVGSRSFTGDQGSGTFGQYIPAIPIEDTASASQNMELIQLRGKTGTTGFRTNIGLINTTGIPEEILIELYSSSSLGQLRITLMPGEYRQLNRIITGMVNAEVSDAWARIRTTTEDGGFFAYASLVDNASGDSIFIPGSIVETEER